MRRSRSQPRPSPARTLARPPGFTLIEVVVALGIVLILTGIFMPTLTSSRLRARQVKNLALCRDNARLIVLYANDHKDEYPMVEGVRFLTFFAWYEPLIAAGLITSATDVDPDGMRLGNYVTFGESVAMFYPPEKMRPGHTESPDQAHAVVIRQSQTLYPAQKGLIHQNFPFPEIPGNATPGWCCVPYRPIAPVAFADTSATLGKWDEFLAQGPLYIENSIGIPVLSTWNGCRGRDR